MAFSIMCMFLTVLYAGFAGLTFAFSKSVLKELEEDERDDGQQMYHNMLQNHHHHHHHHKNNLMQHFGAVSVNNNNVGYDGYIGERFDVVPSRRNGNGTGTHGFVAPTPDKSII